MTESLLCEHLDVYSETFPTSGMTVNGAAYALPTWAPRTDDSESSSLLHTVMADETGGGPLSPETAKQRGQTLRLTGQLIDLVNPDQLTKPPPLLPTTTARDWKSAGTLESHRERTQAQPLSEMMHLLKTPTSQLAVNGGSQHPDKRKQGGHGATLADEVEHILPTPRTASGMKAPLRPTTAKDPSRLEDAVALHLLPTPVAQPSGNTPSEHLRKKPGRKIVTDLAILVENDMLETGGKLLPTPTASEGDKGGPNSRGSKGEPILSGAVTHLFPTPQAHDMQKGKTPDQVKAMRAKGHGVANLNETVENRLLPTPKASDGEFSTPSTSGRPVEKSTFLSTRVMEQQGHLEHRKPAGATTDQPSDGGNKLWEDVPLPLPNPPAETETTD